MGTAGDGRGRRRGASCDATPDDATPDDAARLARARRLFDRTAEMLETEIDRLRALDGAGEAAGGRVKAVADEIRAAQRALMILLEFGPKLTGVAPGTDLDGALDLEAARAEIDGRLARLARQD